MPIRQRYVSGILNQPQKLFRENNKINIRVVDHGPGQENAVEALKKGGCVALSTKILVDYATLFKGGNVLYPPKCCVIHQTFCCSNIYQNEISVAISYIRLLEIINNLHEMTE